MESGNINDTMNKMTNALKNSKIMNQFEQRRKQSAAFMKKNWGKEMLILFLKK